MKLDWTVFLFFVTFTLWIVVDDTIAAPVNHHGIDNYNGKRIIETVNNYQQYQDATVEEEGESDEGAGSAQ
eukprot:Awhi_evm1s12798